jgi:2-iminobutanoate/2-iminopropanoate deaminase
VSHDTISPAERPRSTAPLSAATRLGNLVFTSGAVGADLNGNVPSDIEGQVRNTFENLGAVLEAAGSDFEHVLKVNVYLTDMSEFGAMNNVYRTFFKGELPARTTAGVAALARPGLRVEIEMVAYVAG